MNKIISYGVWRGLPALINVVAILFLSEIYGAEVFGIYNLVFSVTTFIAIVFLNWANISYYRFYFEENEPTVHRVIYLILLSSVFASALLWVALYSLNFDDIKIYILATLILISDGLFETSLVKSRLEFKVSHYGLKLISKAILFVVFALSFYGLSFEDTGLLIAMALAMFIPQIITLRKYFYKAGDHLDKQTIRKYIHFGLPMSLSLAASIHFLTIVKLYMSSNLGYEAVGQFSVTADIMQNVFLVLMLSATLALHPLIIKSQAENSLDMSRKLTELLVVLVVLVVFLGLFFWGGQNIIVRFIGDDYRQTFHSILVPLGIANALLVIKIGFLDFLFTLQKRGFLSLLFSVGMLSIIVATLYALRPTDLYQIAKILVASISLTMLLQVIVINLLRPKR